MLLLILWEQGSRVGPGPTAWWLQSTGLKSIAHGWATNTGPKEPLGCWMPPKSCLPGWLLSALQAKSFVCSRMGGRWRNRAGANKQFSLSEPQSGFLLRNHGVAKITPVSHSGRYWLLAWPQGLPSSNVKCKEIEILLPVHLCSRQVIQPVVVSATAPLYRAQSCHYAEAAKERRKWAIQDLVLWPRSYYCLIIFISDFKSSLSPF